jgi:hypothetical protein
LRLRVAAAFWPRIDAAERGLGALARAPRDRGVVVVGAGDAGPLELLLAAVSVAFGAVLPPLGFVSVAMGS